MKMTKFVLGFVLVFVAFMASNSATVSAASPTDYSAEYSVTNFYTDDGVLVYYFSGLDTGEHYQWILRGINVDGSLGNVISVKNSLGSATATVQFRAIDGDFLLANQTTYAGAAEVIDHFGQTQGRHFMLPGCNLLLSLECSSTDWLSGGAVNPATARNIIAASGNKHPLNADGYFHIYTDPVSVTTQQGGITFFHFRFLFGSVGEYRIYNKNNNAVLYTIDHQDLQEYNTDDRNSFLNPVSYYPTYSFVVLNTNGVRPENINRIEDLTAWANGTNPHTMLVPKGAYDYAHTDGVGNIIADGESTWLVSNVPVNEWGLLSHGNVTESGKIRLVMGSSTEEIWNSGYLNHELNDSLMGLIDSNDYAFTARRSDDYTVNGVSQLGVVSTWSIYPTLSNLGTATLAHRRFDLELTYEINNNFSITDRAETELASLGFDTPLGRALAIILIMFGVFLVMAKYGARSLPGYGIAFLALGGIWVAIGLSDGLTTLLFGISAVVIVWMIVGGIGHSDSEGF